MRNCFYASWRDLNMRSTYFTATRLTGRNNRRRMFSVTQNISPTPEQMTPPLLFSNLLLKLDTRKPQYEVALWWDDLNLDPVTERFPWNEDPYQASLSINRYQNSLNYNSVSTEIILQAYGLWGCMKNPCDKNHTCRPSEQTYTL
jgi:hypothetical protein